jgi:hypothetical protein
VNCDDDDEEDKVENQYVGCGREHEFLFNCYKHPDLGQFCKHCLHEALVSCQSCGTTVCLEECVAPKPQCLCMDCFQVK